MLVALWNPTFHRPTRDIDVAARGSSEADDIVPALQHICRIVVDAVIAMICEAIDYFKVFRTAMITVAVTGKIDVREAVPR